MYSAGWVSADPGQIMKFVLSYQTQPFQLPLMFRTRGDQVDSGGLNGAVAQHVGQLGNVPADLVEGPRKEVPQVVGKHFGWSYPSRFTQGFHLRPNLLSGHGLSVSGEEDLTGDGFVFSGVL